MKTGLDKSQALLYNKTINKGGFTMWMVYNEFGEELCGAENEEQAMLIARLHNGYCKYVADLWEI